MKKQLVEKDLNQFYHIEYNNWDDAFFLGYDQKFFDQYNSSMETYKLLKKYSDISQKMKLLDFGSSVGGTIKFFEEKGFMAYGFDVSEEATKFAKKKGLKAFSNTELISKHTFDIIICTSVLEHLKDPLSILKFFYSIISNNGIILVSVPGFKIFKQKTHYLNCIRGFHILPHLNYFSSKHLIKMIDTAFSGKFTLKYLNEEALIIVQKSNDRYPRDVNMNEEFEGILNYIEERGSWRSFCRVLFLRLKRSVKYLLIDLKLKKK